MEEFIKILRPMVKEQLDSRIPDQPQPQTPTEQFKFISKLSRENGGLHTILMWQRQEIMARLMACHVSIDHIPVYYTMPVRYKILLARSNAILQNSFDLHATRKYLVSYAGKFNGGSAATTRRMLREDKHIEIVKHGKKSLALPAPHWMRTHAIQQLTVMLMQYAYYKTHEHLDPVAAATFQIRWLRDFGFDPTILDIAEEVFDVDKIE